MSRLENGRHLQMCIGGQSHGVITGMSGKKIVNFIPELGARMCSQVWEVARMAAHPRVGGGLHVWRLIPELGARTPFSN
jgi:hypothetical protein